MCHHGNKCQYAHDVADMAPSAREHTMSKVSTTSSKAFLPLQAMSNLSMRPCTSPVAEVAALISPAAPAVEALTLQRSEPTPPVQSAATLPPVGLPSVSPPEAAPAITETSTLSTPMVPAVSLNSPPVRVDGMVEQYCSRVVGFSSQFSYSEHAALQLLGPPKQYPNAGSSKHAWSALPQPNTSRQWVRLGFKKPVYVNQVRIYETFNPGSVSRIRLAQTEKGKHGAESDWVDVFKSSAQANSTDCTAVVSVLESLTL